MGMPYMRWLLDSSHGAMVVIFLGAIFALLLYLLPSILAWVLTAVHWRGIALLNVLLGWTVAGWIAALVWVLFDGPKDPGRDTLPDTRGGKAS